MVRNKKALSIILAVVFMFNVLMPVSAFAGYGSFPDVKDSHWAKQVVTKMNLRGVIGGYEDGTAKPDAPVTQLNAVLMAMRTMGLQDLEESVDPGAYLPVVVPDWAKKSAIVAMEAGLIDQNDFQWNKNASREWVAKLLVKMMGKESEVNSVAGEYLPYKDASKISNKYTNYVKVANKYGLIKGNPDNTFQPQGTVTRAQMVAFLSRAEEYIEIKDKSVIMGHIETINGSNIEVYGTNGQSYVLVTNSQTAMFNKDGKVITSSKLAVGQKVYLIVESNLIKYLEVKDPNAVLPEKLTTIEGEVLQVIEAKNTIVIKTKEEKLETLAVTKATKINRENSNTQLSLGEIAVKDKVIVKVNQKQEAAQITIKGSGTYSNEGTIYHIDLGAKLIIIEHAQGLKTYRISENTGVEIGNNRFASVNDLLVGDKVKVETIGDTISKITVVAGSEKFNGEGVIKQISKENRFITFEADNSQLKSHYLAADAVITFGNESGTVNDLKVGDEISVEIIDGKIKTLAVENRKINDGFKGTVIGVDANNRVLTVKDKDGILKAYEVHANASIRVNDSSSSLTYVKKDMAVELEISEGVITSLNADSRIRGTVVNASDRNNTIEITVEGTNQQKLYSTKDNVYVDIENDSSSDLDDLNKGDKVVLKLENGIVTEVDVESVIDYTVVETFTSSTVKVRVADKDGDEENLYIYSDVDLIIPGISNPKVRDIEVNDQIKATYVGSELVSVEVTSQVAGTVSSINTSSKTVKINGYDGKSYTINFDNNSYVKENGKVYYSLSYLSIGDRVAVTESASEGNGFNLLEKKSGKVGVFYTDKSMIFLQKTSTAWDSYVVSPDVYIHENGRVLSPSSFPLDTYVDLYMSNGVVYEVEKR